LPRQKYLSHERKIYRLGEISLESRVFFRLSENTLAWARIPHRLGENTSLLGQKISRLGENTSESTLAPGAFSPGRLYPRLGETTFSPGRGTSSLGKNSLESILATRNHSRLGELCRKHKLSDNLCSFYYHRATTHVSDD